MNKYLIQIQYDGLAHKGWQRLSDNPNTVQGIIEAVLSDYSGRKTLITGSGRTDAGVSAYGQCADFLCDMELDTQSLSDINKLLPETINIISIRKVEISFHSRKSCVQKTYIYRISLSSKCDVFSSKYIYNTMNAPINNAFGAIENNQPDLNAMRTAACVLTGTNDYSAFTSDKSKRSKIRTIYSIDISVNNNILTISVTGNGFLYNMVRIIAGTLLEVGLNRLSVESVKLALTSKERRYSGATLPSNALFLSECKYND